MTLKVTITKVNNFTKYNNLWLDNSIKPLHSLRILIKLLETKNNQK